MAVGDRSDPRAAVSLQVAGVRPLAELESKGCVNPVRTHESLARAQKVPCDREVNRTARRVSRDALRNERDLHRLRGVQATLADEVHRFPMRDLEEPGLSGSEATLRCQADTRARFASPDATRTCRVIDQATRVRGSAAVTLRALDCAAQSVAVTRLHTGVETEAGIGSALGSDGIAG